MRIRKNANLSSLMFSHASGAQPLQTHVCLLNQSPWDVIPFSQEPYPSSLHQLEGEDSFNGNGSLGDSIGAVESSSFHSVMEDAAEEKKVDKMLIDDNYEMEEEEEEMKIKSGGGKGRHYKNDQKQGHSMRDHYLTSMKSHSPALPVSQSTKKQPEKSIASGRRGRAKAAKKGTSSASNPYEFYYYSGFGPPWGKRRGGGEIINKCAAEIDCMPQNTTSSSPPSSIDHFEELDFFDEDDEDSENGESGKKRMRKPVKARSLKSLM